ncbi:murein hydrolase activator EnvC family protein [Streptomyces sp. GS7]|uniref:murein hydrolase activator EnvC family protein n=1 Tax=Streptomyces sp. GS7 TaxID=2692234 RepID=UPI00131624E1|nr:M23 family metallopeptidase [Streptomyces sp. GS7]QHC27275.1 peptidoglycan DD-metalloendopeptidase family protein [Streptomyces sp. GS7]
MAAGAWDAFKADPLGLAAASATVRATRTGPEDRAASAAADRSWPVDGPAGLRPTVLRGWEPPPSPWAAGHRGVDLAASPGAVVRAAAPGQVAFAGTVAGRGVLTIELSDSGHPPLRTTYEPVRATARPGQHVTAGQPVGELQRGPFHCRAPCLHWGLLRGKSYLDPLSLLPPAMLHGGPSRLLPVFGIPEPTIPATPGRTESKRPVPGRPAPTAHKTTDAPTSAALVGAIALATAALWALGRHASGGRGGANGVGRLRVPYCRWGMATARRNDRAEGETEESTEGRRMR